MNRLVIFGVVVVAALYALLSSIYIVDERQRALVLQFGQIKDIRDEPGIGFKIPFFQNVAYYDDRILSLDTDPLEVTPLDDRRLEVDAFARWRIADVRQFREATGSDGDFASTVGGQRLERIVNAAVREVLGGVTSDAILSADRVALMAAIRDEAIAESAGLGVEVVDVRIKRADLPEQNLEATFERMQAERQREAEDERARGREARLRVESTADREAVGILSEAQRESEIIRGEADAERNRIFAEAFGQDPEFFAFYRSLNAYALALRGDNATMVITPDSEFFSYFDGVGEFTTTDAPVQPVTMPDEDAGNGEAPAATDQ